MLQTFQTILKEGDNKTLSLPLSTAPQTARTTMSACSLSSTALRGPTCDRPYSHSKLRQVCTKACLAILTHTTCCSFLLPDRGRWTKPYTTEHLWRVTAILVVSGTFSIHLYHWLVLQKISLYNRPIFSDSSAMATFSWKFSKQDI